MTSHHYLANDDVTIEYNRFQDLEFDLLTQSDILKEKQSQIEAGYHGGELKTVWMMESWSAADSLKRMENQMLGDRDKLHKLDQSIVLLYMKILAYQSSKVHTTMKKLETLRHKDGSQGCPIDYTVQSYQEWTRTNPKIHALQSEVLELLARKIKYRTRAMEEENIKTFSLKDFAASKMEKLRSQTLFFLERDPLVDADFSLHVSSVVNVEANTFEAERMRRFIAFCWGHKFSEDLGQMYQEFVGALVEHIMNKFGHMRRSGQSKNELTRDQIFAIIEGHLIPHIYDCIHQYHPDDVIMRQKFYDMNKKSQAELGMDTHHIDPSHFPYHEAVLKLRELTLLRLPTQKLRAIILASQCVLQKMNSLCADKEIVAGADEFIDVWVFVTIQSAIPNLCWDIQYLKQFSNPNYMLSETGYYLSSLEMAAEYIKTLSSDVVDGHKRPRNDGRCFLLMADTSAARRLCEWKKCPLRLVDEVVLKGYSFTTNSHMMIDTSRVLQYAIVPASSDDRCIKMLRIKVPAECHTELVKRYLQLDKHHDIVLAETKMGLAPFISSTESVENFPESQTFHFQSMSESWCDTRDRVTLKYLGVSFDGDLYSESVHDCSSCILRNGNEQGLERLGFGTQHGLKEEENVTSILKNIILQIQNGLKRLNIYSNLLPSDGIHSLVLRKSIQQFQRQQQQQQQSNSLIIRQDGFCDQQTYDRLKELTDFTF